MKTAVEFLELMFLRILSFDSEEHRKKYKDAMRQAKEMEKEQQGYSEEEVLNFTQTIIQQYKSGNTNIEQLDLLKETLQLFKNK